jgi:hypothetical protein
MSFVVDGESHSHENEWSTFLGIRELLGPEFGSLFHPDIVFLTHDSETRLKVVLGIFRGVEAH